VKEASYANVPTIGFCDTDSPVRYVDIAIPCNTKADRSIGLMYYLLAREILYLRGTLERGLPWEIMVDAFFPRPPEDQKQKKELEDRAYEEYRPEPSAPGEAVPTEWGATQPEATAWDQPVPTLDAWGTASDNWADAQDATPAPAVVLAPSEGPAWGSNPLISGAGAGWDQ